MHELHLEPYSDDKDFRADRPNKADIAALAGLVLSVVLAFSL
jgi:hypothetical protein